MGAAYELSGTAALERISGWLGLALALAGTYLALALLLEDADIEQEAGVRSQL